MFNAFILSDLFENFRKIMQQTEGSFKYYYYFWSDFHNLSSAESWKHLNIFHKWNWYCILAKAFIMWVDARGVIGARDVRVA